MPATLTELRSTSTNDLYERLLTTHSDDNNIKRVLLERLHCGDVPQVTRLKPQEVAHQVSSIIPPLDLSDKDGDTRLTARVKEALRLGYLGEFTDDPSKTLLYMELQIEKNPEERDIDFPPIRRFWEMWHDKYSLWKARKRRMAS